MKVEINKDGRLLISAETELEQYALRLWCAENVKEAKIDLANAVISWGTEVVIGE